MGYYGVLWGGDPFMPLFSLLLLKIFYLTVDHFLIYAIISGFGFPPPADEMVKKGVGYGY